VIDVIVSSSVQNRVRRHDYFNFRNALGGPGWNQLTGSQQEPQNQLFNRRNERAMMHIDKKTAGSGVGIWPDVKMVEARKILRLP
jgi:hypothetical protein